MAKVFRPVHSKNPLKKALQETIRAAMGLPVGRGRVTNVVYDRGADIVKAHVHVPGPPRASDAAHARVQHDADRKVIVPVRWIRDLRKADTDEQINVAEVAEVERKIAKAGRKIAAELDKEREEAILQDALDNAGVAQTPAPVRVLARPSTIPGTPRVSGFQGILTRVYMQNGEPTADVVEIKTNGTRSTPLSTVRAMRRPSPQLVRFLEDVAKAPRAKAHGRDVDAPHIEPNSEKVAAVVTDSLNKRSKTMATANSKAKSDTKKERKPRKPKIDFAGLGADDFFTENAKGKPVFIVGMDARLKGMLKRIAAGNASKDEERIAKLKAVVTHPKVTGSEHFVELYKEAGIKVG